MKRNFEEIMQTDQNCHDHPSKVVLVERNSEPNGIALVNSQRIATTSYTELMELESNQELAERFLKANFNNKWDVIGRQVKQLHNLMEDVVKETKLNNELNKAACNFVKVPGHIYHLYEKPSGQHYFSMLSPEDWGNIPHRFIGSFKLEADLSWVPADKIEDKYEGLQFLQTFLGGKMKELLGSNT